MFNNPHNWGGGIPYRPNHSIIPPRFNYFSLYPHYIPPHHFYNIAREWDWVIKYQIIHQPSYISYVNIDKSCFFSHLHLGNLENFSHQPPTKMTASRTPNLPGRCLGRLVRTVQGMQRQRCRERGERRERWRGSGHLAVGDLPVGMIFNGKFIYTRWCPPTYK